MNFEIPWSITIAITNFRTVASIFYPEDRANTFLRRDKGCPLNYILTVPVICFWQRDIKKMEVKLFIELSPWHQVLQKLLRRPQILKNFAQFYGIFTASFHLSLIWARRVHSRHQFPLLWNFVHLLKLIPEKIIKNDKVIIRIIYNCMRFCYELR